MGTVCFPEVVPSGICVQVADCELLSLQNDKMIGFPSPDGLKLVVAEPNTKYLAFLKLKQDVK
jgi:hypothetical protein